MFQMILKASLIFVHFFPVPGLRSPYFTTPAADQMSLFEIF